MKFATYHSSNGPRLGLVVEDDVIDLEEASNRDLPNDVTTFLQMGERGMEKAREIEANLDSPRQPISEVKLLAPLPRPPKVVAIGLNYMDHCREVEADVPERPLIFSKFSSSIIGPGETIRWNPALTSQVDYEAELAVVIGRTARHVSEEEAMDYVAGYTICHDVSARDLQFGDGQWIRGKSLDTFCPLGPYLVTRDEIEDPHKLAIRCIIDGEVLQDSSTAELIFNVPELIAFCSQSFILQPGDVIITGTPSGVGVSRTPQRFLKDGDTVTIEIEGLGSLTNPCMEEATAGEPRA